ncbi:MAG: peptidyl-prolyl cis-trans isomerase [Alphaproteobacteria bacterium]
MLISMRKFGGKWVLGIFSALIIAGFGLFGISDVVRGILSRSGVVVASVDGIEISNPEINREFQLQIAQLQAYFGNQLDSAQAVQLGILNQAVDVLIVRRLYDLEVERLGLEVSDKMLRDDIRDSRLFANIQGEFDANYFASFLAAQRISEDAYLATRRDEIMRGQLASAITGGAAVSKFLLDSVYNYQQERRIAEYAIITNHSITGIPAPSEGELSDFHRANAHRFTAPEYRALSYIHITPEDIFEEIAISEDELEAEYDDRHLEFMQPERRAVEQIVAFDAAAARDIHDRLSAGDDFVAVAAAMTGAEADDLSLGTVSRNELFGDMADVVFGLSEGDFSEPVETALGWHIFHLTAIEPARSPTLDEVRDKLIHDISLSRAADALYDFANKLDDKFADSATIEEAADELALPFHQLDGIDIDGDGPDGSFIDGLPAGADFLATAFATANGETSLVIEAGDGSEFVVRVDRVIAPALRPLDDVRQAVSDGWTDEQRDIMATSRAEAAVERIEAGESYAQVVADLGLVPLSSEPVRRDGDGAKAALSNELVAALFALGRNGAAAGVTRDGLGHALIRLADIVRADGSADAAGYEQQQQSIRDGITHDLMDQYRAYLQQRYPVMVNSGALQALY